MWVPILEGKRIPRFTPTTALVNRLFAVYLSLLHVWANRQLPHLEALWQLAPLPEHHFVPALELLAQFRQWTQQLEADAYWLLEDVDFLNVVLLLKNPPPPITFYTGANSVPDEASLAWVQERSRLEVADDPKEWLAAKLRVPFSISGFNFLIEEGMDGECKTYTACRYALSIALGTATVELSINASHCYGRCTFPFRLKEQQEEIAEQLGNALPAGTPGQLIQEISCLACYGVQIFALADRLEKTNKSREEGRVEDVSEST